MKPLSIRASLTGWFVALTLLLLAAFSGTLYVGLRRALHVGLDAQLRARADGLAALCDWDEEIGDVEVELAPDREGELAGGPGERSFEVRRWPEGSLLRSGGPPLPELAADLSPAAGVPLLTDGGAPARRVLTLRVHRDALMDPEEDFEKPPYDVLVRVGEGLAPVDAQLADVRTVIGVLALFSVLVVLAFGLFLSRRFVGPLRSLGAAAAEVRARRQARMPRRGSGDEVDRLAGILDEAFASLETALARQTRFTADAAHELRNPISVICNAAEVALRNERTGPEYRRFLGDVLQTGRRMARIVEALLLLARMDSGTATPTEEVDLALVARAAAAAQGEEGQRIRVLDGAPAVVRGEPGLLRILVDNLLGNALRYSGADDPVEVSVARDGGSVTLSVRDFGRGVSGEQAEHVFERFYRGSPDGNGCGLGLSIVAEVARLHSAECRLEPLDRGTRVTVRFPAR